MPSTKRQKKKSAAASNHVAADDTFCARQRGYRKYKEICEGFVALRPLPTDETVSMIDAVRGDLPRSERVIAKFPSGEQMCAWMTEAHGSAPPQRGEVVLFPHQGGIFPLQTGQCGSRLGSTTSPSTPMVVICLPSRSSVMYLVPASAGFSDPGILVNLKRFPCLHSCSHRACPDVPYFPYTRSRHNPESRRRVGE